MFVFVCLWLEALHRICYVPRPCVCMQMANKGCFLSYFYTPFAAVGVKVHVLPVSAVQKEHWEQRCFATAAEDMLVFSWTLYPRLAILTVGAVSGPNILQPCTVWPLGWRLKLFMDCNHPLTAVHYHWCFISWLDFQQQRFLLILKIFTQDTTTI